MRNIFQLLDLSDFKQKHPATPPKFFGFVTIMAKEQGIITKEEMYLILSIVKGYLKEVNPQGYDYTGFEGQVTETMSEKLLAYLPTKEREL